MVILLIFNTKFILIIYIIDLINFVLAFFKVLFK